MCALVLSCAPDSGSQTSQLPTNDPSISGGEDPGSAEPETRTPEPVAPSVGTPAPSTGTPAPSQGSVGSPDPCWIEGLSQNVIEVCQLTNKQRQAQGLTPLTLSPPIVFVSQMYALDMETRNYFSHTGPSGETMSSRLKAGGISFKAAGENIARGYKTPAIAVGAWMNSSGHRANILNSRYRKLGVGVQGTIWVQDFTD